MMIRQYYLVAICFFSLQLLISHAETYLISSQANFDHLKTETFQPEDLILFKKGVSFVGMFSPKGKGTSESPIRIDVYGQGHSPRIEAKGRAAFA